MSELPENDLKRGGPVQVVFYLPRPQSLSKGGEENEKKFFQKFFPKKSHHALPGNDITATDLYRLQLHCTVPNEGPAEEAGILLPEKDISNMGSSVGNILQ